VVGDLDLSAGTAGDPPAPPLHLSSSLRPVNRRNDRERPLNAP